MALTTDTDSTTVTDNTLSCSKWASWSSNVLGGHLHFPKTENGVPGPSFITTVCATVATHWCFVWFSQLHTFMFFLTSTKRGPNQEKWPISRNPIFEIRRPNLPKGPFRPKKVAQKGPIPSSGGSPNSQSQRATPVLAGFLVGLVACALVVQLACLTLGWTVRRMAQLGLLSSCLLSFNVESSPTCWIATCCRMCCVTEPPGYGGGRHRTINHPWVTAISLQIATAAALLSVVGPHSAPRLQKGHLPSQNE